MQCSWKLLLYSHISSIQIPTVVWALNILLKKEYLTGSNIQCQFTILHPNYIASSNGERERAIACINLQMTPPTLLRVSKNACFWSNTTRTNSFVGYRKGLGWIPEESPSLMTIHLRHSFLAYGAVWTAWALETDQRGFWTHRHYILW